MSFFDTSSQTVYYYYANGSKLYFKTLVIKNEDTKFTLTICIEIIISIEVGNVKCHIIIAVLVYNVAIFIIFSANYNRETVKI